MAEQHSARGRDDTAVMLSHDMVDHRDMGAIVKHDTLLAVMDVNVIRNDVLADHKPVLEALDCHTANDVYTTAF